MMGELMNKPIWLLLGGIVALIGGIIALFNPFAATITAELLTGWAFLISGVLALIGAFADMRWGARIWIILLGIIFIWAGITLLRNPLAGILTLTLAMAFVLVASGIVQTVTSFAGDVRHSAAFWPVLLSGIISLLLGFWVLSDFPLSAAIYLGIVLAVQLITTGVSMLSLYSVRKRAMA